ncbi:BA75_00074T0 [Komagataella pastoris]|uniref:BA75_00074T0 n=1 Tax=Komagataella pastoris TaxID=4922 RepID=A0A1B2J819_PICPA|nr:BA75_00074T0 [Komagataella pastoris]
MEKRANEKSLNTGEPKKQKKSLSIPVSDWPEYFQTLEKIHFRINTYFTFLCSRKHLVTTWELIKTAPESALKRQVTLEEGAQIASLLPDNVNFEYIDENQIHTEKKQFTYKRGWEQKETDIFQLKDSDSDLNMSKQILIFEFVDGKIQKERDGISRYSSANALTTPTFSQDSMKKLISKRNTNFEIKVSQFLHKCYENSLDPQEELSRIAKAYIPHTATYQDPIEEMVSNSTKTPSQPSHELRDPIPVIIDHLKQTPFYRDQISDKGLFHLQPKEPIYEELDFELSPEIWTGITHTKKIDKLYSHQAEALNSICVHKKHVIISTSTSSGKSLIYQIPLLKALQETNGLATALYVFPTKALAQDQKRSLNELIKSIPSLFNTVLDTYDGDTEKSARLSIREHASVIFTNPDMLHSSILPSHRQWVPFLRNLRYVVIDELHMYKGLFGAHVALIMRRLRRLCSIYGNDSVQFISCSATLKYPMAHMHNIFGIDESDCQLIVKDGSPSGGKYVVTWNPPNLISKTLSQQDGNSSRESFIIQTAKVLVQLVLKNVRTICFCVVRRVCELLMKEVRSQLKSMDKLDLVTKVMSYRGGYSTSDRRKIEKEMFNGNLKCIISTNALELGIDIGTLDCVVMCGFPLSIANFQQQSGRAGRRNKDSLTIVVGSDDPVNRHYMNNPQELISMEYQDLVLDFSNTAVLESHLQCAAFEKPITDLDWEAKWFSDYNQDQIEEILANKLDFLETSPDYPEPAYHVSSRYLPWPSSHVSIRAIEEENYAVVDITNNRNVVIEEVEASRTSFTLYDGGIFIHQGLPYIVRDFNSDDKYAKVERVNVDWITSQRDFTDVDPVEVEKIRSLKNGSDVPIYFGKIYTTIVVFGFFKKNKIGEIIDAVEVNNPPIIIKSKGIWIDIPSSALDFVKMKHLNIAGGIHAAQHAIMNILPLFILSGVDEIQTECKAPEKEFATRQTKRVRPARLIFYDAKGGQCGSGLSTKAFEYIDDILEKALNTVLNCPSECEWGCPNCVAAPFCKENSLVLSKPAAIIILATILKKTIDLSSIPSGPEPFMPDIQIETIGESTETVKLSKDIEIIDVRKASTPLEEIPKDEELVFLGKRAIHKTPSTIKKEEDP